MLANTEKITANVKSVKAKAKVVIDLLNYSQNVKILKTGRRLKKPFSMSTDDLRKEVSNKEINSLMKNLRNILKNARTIKKKRSKLDDLLGSVNEVGLFLME